MATTYSRDELLAFADALVKAMGDGAFVEQMKDAVRRAPVPDTDDALVERIEQVQADYLAHAAPPPSGHDSSDDHDHHASAAAAVDGSAAMAQLREAVRLYPDKQVEDAVTQLCMATESHMIQLTNVMPELHALRQKHESEMRSHGAAAGADAHAQHPGAAMHDAQTMNMMQMAMRTLTPQQRGTLERMQRAMMQGRPPTPDDMQDMQQIQQHLTAFMQTMSQFGSGAKP